MGVGLHEHTTAHTFVCGNVLGAFLMQCIKIESYDIPGEYPMLLDDLAEKAPVLALELGHGVIFILTLCVIFLFSTSTRSMSICSGRLGFCCIWVDDLVDAWWEERGMMRILSFQIGGDRRTPPASRFIVSRTRLDPVALIRHRRHRSIPSDERMRAPKSRILHPLPPPLLLLPER